jgi:hypothetical protein
MADDDSFGRYVAVRLAEHHGRARLHRFAKTEKEARQTTTAIERQQATDKRPLCQMRLVTLRRARAIRAGAKDQAVAGVAPITAAHRQDP